MFFHLGWFSKTCFVAGLVVLLLSPIAYGYEAILRGTHYFGNSWPVNVWNSARLSSLEADLARLRRDGFNTIVLVMPWGEFQPKIKPCCRYDDVAFERLHIVLRAAQAADLAVVLRVGYAHSFSPQQDLMEMERLVAFFADNTVREAFFDFCSRLYRISTQYDHIRFGFLSWEDFYLPGILAEPALRERLEQAQLKRDFAEFLRVQMPLTSASTYYGKTFQRLESVPLPAPDGPQAIVLHTFWDWFIINKLFVPARHAFPTLSFEIRVDDDPVVEPSGASHWFVHQATYQLPGAPVDTIYWAVFWGMENKGDTIPGDRAMQALGVLLDRVEARTGRSKIFIDQFVFLDNTPDKQHLTRIRDPDVNDFLEQAGTLLAQRTLGYTLWSDRAYRWNVLYNAAFERDLLGWQAAGDAALERTSIGNILRMRAGGRLAQTIPVARRLIPRDAGELCLKGEAFTPAAMRVVMGAADALTLDLDLGRFDVCRPVPVPFGQDVVFEVQQGSLAIERLIISIYTESSDIYRVDGSEGRYIPGIRRLNAAIAKAEPASRYEGEQLGAHFSGVFEDMWIGETAEGILAIPSAPDRKRTLVVETWATENWPAGVVLDIAVDGTPLTTVTCGATARIDLDQPPSISRSTKFGILRLVSNKTVVPADHGLGSDQRALSCVLHKAYIEIDD